MKSLRAPFVCVLVATLSGACGGSQPKPAEPGGPVATATPTAVPDVAGGRVQLSPIGAPERLLAVGRIQSPGPNLDQLSAWMGAPIEWNREIERELPGVTEVLMPEASVEAALALRPDSRKPEPSFAFSVPLKSIDRALELASREGRPQQSMPGVYLMPGAKCAIAASLGAAPARFVCADEEASLEQLLPYMTRGLPAEQLGDSAIHMEFRAGNVRKLYERELRQVRSMAVPYVLSEIQLDEPRFDRALGEALNAVADEVLVLANDLDRFAIDVRLDPAQRAAQISTSLKLNGESSFVAQTMIESQAAGTGVPELFWRLPKDATSASFGRSAKAQRFQPIGRALGELADGALGSFKVPQGVRTQVVDLLAEAFKFEGTSVYAALPPTAAQATAAVPANASSRAHELALMRRMFGVHMMITDSDVKRWKGFFDRFVKLYNDAALRKEIDRRTKLDKAVMPTFKARATKGLPGATTYELAIPANTVLGKPPSDAKPEKLAPLTLLLVVAGDATSSYVVFGLDEAEAAARIKAARAGTGGLQDRADLGEVRALKTPAGGFFTINGLVASADAAAERRHRGGGAAEVLARMPSKGLTPLPFSAQLTRGGGVELTYALRVPEAALRDVGTALPYARNSARSAFQF